MSIALSFGTRLALTRTIHSRNWRLDTFIAQSSFLRGSVGLSEARELQNACDEIGLGSPRGHESTSHLRTSAMLRNRCSIYRQGARSPAVPTHSYSFPRFEHFLRGPEHGVGVSPATPRVRPRDPVFRVRASRGGPPARRVSHEPGRSDPAPQYLAADMQDVAGCGSVP